MYIKIILILPLVLYLTSCAKPENKKLLPNHQHLLANALAVNGLQQSKEIIPLVHNSNNAQNIIQLYLIMREEGELAFVNEVNYLQPLYPSMEFIHQSMFAQMQKWLYLKQIYRQEVLPPVRILQQEKLYLAPSNIDFNKCNTIKSYCANDARASLLKIMTSEEISKKLKQMAIKDPCVNLSTTLKGEAKANRCLKYSKGNLKIKLLAKPSFSFDEWLQAINS
ncbi:MAG: hypothetical protein L3J53_03415 [Proteobacteria bacterium]|nr:hypothetical protein [Pseudomonadota bacterium]